MNEWRRIAAVMAGVLSIIGCTMTPPIHYPIESTFSVNDPEFTRTIGELLGPPIIPGNKITTYRNGDEIFPAMLDAIRHARKTVTLETYVFWSGHVAHEFTDALAGRARAGVKVRVLIDGIGGDRLGKSYVVEMKNAGVEVHKYHPFYVYDINTYLQINYRAHRKLLVVDGNIGFTGGAGIADPWDGHAQDPKHWRDNHYRIDGPGVAQIQAAFADNWKQTTGASLEGDDFFPPLAVQGDVATQLFKTSPTRGTENMQILMRMFLAHAKKSVFIETAYFVPDSLLRDALENAAKRGLDVEIVVPGPHIDQPFIRAASRATWGYMLQSGVKIYEYQPTMIHCKMLVVDGAWTSIGSANIDARSFGLNDEANLNVHNPAFAQQQTRIFEDDKAQSRLITYDAWKHRPLSESFFDRLFSTMDFEL
jgi:cardiolipin synthase